MSRTAQIPLSGPEVRSNSVYASAMNSTNGRIMHGARAYDLLVRLVTFGRERQLRETMIRLARIEPGEAVLDVGCGTGTLAIAAARAVGPTGAVSGIDASPAMIARAITKSRKAGVNVAFQHAVVEALPFPAARFDVVLSTMMLHHLPRTTRQQCAAEIRRVLKPRGRVLVVDFGRAQQKHVVFAHLHRHGHVDFADVTAILTERGLTPVDAGAVGFSSLRFVLASAQ